MGILAVHGEEHVNYVEGDALAKCGLCIGWFVDVRGNVRVPNLARRRGVVYLGIPCSARYIEPFSNDEVGFARVLHNPFLVGFCILRDGLPAHAITTLGEPVVGIASTDRCTRGSGSSSGRGPKDCRVPLQLAARSSRSMLARIGRRR